MEGPSSGDVVLLEGIHLQLAEYLWAKANKKGFVQASNEELARRVFGSSKTSSGKVRAHLVDLFNWGIILGSPAVGVLELQRRDLIPQFSAVMTLGGSGGGTPRRRLSLYDARREGGAGAQAPKEPQNGRSEAPTTTSNCDPVGVWREYNPKPLTMRVLARDGFPLMLESMGAGRWEASPRRLETALNAWERQDLKAPVVLQMMREFAQHPEWSQTSKLPAWLVFVKRKASLVKLVQQPVDTSTVRYADGLMGLAKR